VSERPICKTCPHWKNLHDGEQGGECRRYPPTLPRSSELIAEIGPYGGGFSYPDSPSFGWCGEHPHFALFVAVWPISTPPAPEPQEGR
jgi:hypothetical protein